MVTIKVYIEWCNKNYGATIDEQVPGSVVVTEKTIEALKKAVAETVAFHLEGMKADGEELPAWLSQGYYNFEWILGTSALLRTCEKYTSIAAIARATGINAHLLSHYANGIKKPRKQQREKIVEGLHRIGREFLTIV